ncbi:MAG TPA: hypothetical protein VKR53_16725 [Puia sp.]|nr:hypothetical protein [Puia sp.]
MDCKEKQYTKLIFKLLLLAVYFVFFTVQLFLRYSSCHAQQSLDLDSYQKNLTEKSLSSTTVLSKDDRTRSLSLSYLNKRFHPENNLFLPDLALQIKNSDAIRSKKFYFVDDRVAELKMHAPTLRGPPTI